LDEFVAIHFVNFVLALAEGALSTKSSRRIEGALPYILLDEIQPESDSADRLKGKPSLDTIRLIDIPDTHGTALGKRTTRVEWWLIITRIGRVVPRLRRARDVTHVTRSDPSSLTALLIDPLATKRIHKVLDF
jgi:hypothetical protein